MRDFFQIRQPYGADRNGLFGCHVDAFVASLSELGYARATVKLQLLFLGDLDKWLKRKRLTLVDLDDPVVTQFLKSRQRNGRLRRSDRQTARYLLEYLREKGRDSIAGANDRRVAFGDAAGAV